MTRILFIIFLNVFAVLMLSNCSNKHIETNIDKENFTEYFSAAKVKIYESEADIKKEYKLIASVEGYDCQKKPHHASPDKINARTQARQQAFEQKANGIVFSGCAELSPTQLQEFSQSNDALQCHAIVICYGKAYAVKASKRYE